jgi:chromosome segregation protein
LIFKKLELHGFKSFFDRTEVHFRPGINAVVGPNGCGKSNIADAIRWVLGEQSSKQLRGDKMEDLIFGGTETRHPLGMAEVSLTVETTGEEIPAPYNKFTEVCVTRRLYRSGESEFFINNTACRMKDIRELFLDTGMNPKAYAVIDQGSIGHIVSAHPEDRRVLIEEAAGIAKFKERKAAALRKLEATQENLLRLGDLTHEVKRQLGSLQRAARKTERYHELKGHLEDVELRVVVHQHGTLLERIRGQEERIRGLEELQETLRNETATQETDLETARLGAVELEKGLGALREEFYARRAQCESFEQRLQAGQTRLAGLRGTLVRGEAEAARLAGLVESHVQDRERIATELRDLQVLLAGKESAAHEVGTRLAGAAATARELKERLDDATARFRDGVRVESDARSRIAQLETRADAVGRDLERISRELVSLGEEETVLAGREEEFEQDRAAKQARQTATAEELAVCSGALAEARDTARRVDGEIAAAREELGTATSRLASLTELERNLSGWPELFQDELNRILSHQDLSGGVRGLLADGIHVGADHENALEAVLGDRLKCLLVNSPAVGIEAARVIQEGGAVRGTFLPLQPTARPALAGPTGAAVLGRLLDVVTVPDDLREIAAHLLQDVFLVTSLTAADALRREEAGAGCTYVTPTGEVLWPDGAVTAGRLDPARELLPIVRGIRETRALAAAAEARLQDLVAQQQTLRAHIQELEERSQQLAAEGRRLEMELSSLEKDLQVTRQKRQAHAAQRARLEEAAAAAGRELDTIEQQLVGERSRGSALAAERSRQEEEIAVLEGEVATHHREEKIHLEQLSALQVELAAGRERSSHLATRGEHLVAESARAEERRRQLLDETELARAEEHQVAAEVEELAATRAGLAEERDGLEARLNTAQAEHRELSGRIRETEERLRLLRGRREELQGEVAGLQVRLAEEQVRREHLRGRMVELKNCTPEELWDEPTRQAVLETPLADLEQRHRELTGQIQALGPVNLAAIGDQQELQERLDSQRKQQEDLEQATRDLHQAIQKINETSRQKFLETFERINEKFQEVFPLLLENGHALLRLTDAEDSLDAGVEVLAQPAGKKLQTITLLSGGEKAMTAIALLLSIFMVKPTPFCLMDEVDAPLDEANTKRFLNVIRHSIEGSQLVMITHNKRTMATANHLVGVTMSDPGVSRLISVQLRERQAQAS